MKAFSKEWWKEAAKQCTIEVYYHKTLGDKFEIPKYADLRDYCFNRYAEAYHREKMAQCMRLTNPAIEERERILGIIEEEGEIYSPKNPFESAAIMFKNELIEKIKG